MQNQDSCCKYNVCQSISIIVENYAVKDLCFRNMAADALKELKQKAIIDFEELIHKISYGYSPDYTKLMNEICFIEVNAYLDNSELYYEYFINNEL